MPDVLIRNIDEKTLNKLKKRAEKNNRSLQAELKILLEEEASMNMDEAKDMVREIYEKYKAEGRVFSDSVKDIREDRDR
ncbi:MAG TPA: hypothetical protein DCL80_11725 [Balneola sp.]|jgi:plasmid stability protein|nr:hypothetical protein [Balneola sp.]MAO77614.1 hypothetical protein [Balneola sp.]MBF64811.1 hypothetical protein [Balneola sp.]HAH51875.1 hypothetical protein [Balneola sp.]HAW81876.1 hypothetical protein [Balneola sp.]|tara:strand:+ start:1127 stop:1363 length:237 start_codon:yes stop_codon:yes gene_type:complete